MTKDNSTPRPWKISESGNPNFKWCVVAPDGGSVCHITTWAEQEENAQLIVRAVNRDHVFEELVDVCKEWVQWFEYVSAYHNENLCKGLKEAEENWNNMLTPNPSPSIEKMKLALSKASKLTEEKRNA